ncbi:acyl-CoA dehydrogenase family protein [Ferruginivarius sediminum]|uniref:DNA alkylation response protein n=1 Tax=Ferruginivarius sediminum TaxID=2661937 RepID=A0A369TGR5_9PROT|nr:acyl-CoA dehydrogenase family protein [Ferruginivarius sediminum]RDD63804.1 DNA alkylation response protein [Ferruginivarius sediminum]
MRPREPRTTLETHEVTNQPPPFEEVNLYASDLGLREAIERAGAGGAENRLQVFGSRVGSAEVAEWAIQANRNPPELRNFDRYGHRIDEVSYHPAYHNLMELGLTNGIACAAWTGESAGHTVHAALLFLMTQAEPSVCCPMSMTYAGVAALQSRPDPAATWVQSLTRPAYDPASRPMAEKSAATLGMAMTEKQGGSDVRANTTAAHSLGDGTYELVGHKWFCSAPMSDGFLTLAQAEGGLTCFLVPRWRPDGTRNPIHIMRLKDKLGDRANASSEIEYHGAMAWRVGEEGRGVRTIIEMVQHTRLDCTVAPAAQMRQAVANACWHAAHRTAFQRRLLDQPLMRQVLADLILESEAATALAFRIAQSFDARTTDAQAAAFARVATPVGKYWLNKRLPNLVYEAMEAHGGAGYVEESVMPRIYRQAPLNSIWEGSGNVICLDVLRALQRAPEAGEAILAEVAATRGHNAHLDAFVDALKDRFKSNALAEADGRRLTEDLALALQGSLLIRHAPAAVADAFCVARLSAEGGYSYGTSVRDADVDSIIARGMPQL